MPDTIYILKNSDSIRSFDSLPEELKDSLRSIIRLSGIDKNDTRPHTLVPLFTVLIILGVVYYFGFKRAVRAKNHILNVGEIDTAEIVQPIEKAVPAYRTYLGNNLGLSLNEIVPILQKFYPYYNNLNPFQKEKFTNRLQAFMQQKVFKIYADEGFKEMPVLLSAAAIQITFGLEEYLLPHYRYIQAHPEEYFAENSFRVLAGNVEGNAITFAWNQFLKGIIEPNDGVNVGLHEMAHALYYQHVVVDGSKEKYFCSCFDEIMEEGSEVYELKNKQHILFTDYAFKNLQEFWAESVELFFERPVDLQNGYPELFGAIKELLNQNPINSSNPVLLA